jgi:hypothetical protein
MGKESHRWYWKTTWPSVKLGKVPDRERKACLNFGVTFCITNPIYFGALGQCLHVNVISSRQLDFVTNSQKPFCNPIWGPLVLDLNEKVKPPSSPASYTWRTLRLWNCFSFTRQALGIHILQQIPFCIKLPFRADLYLNKSTCQKGEFYKKHDLCMF